MNIKLSIKPDEEYYKEFYSEFKNLKTIRRLEPFLAVSIILAGVTFELFDTTNRLGIFPFVFVALGIYELIKLIYKRKKWMKERLNSKISGQILTLEFTESNIIHEGPFSQGNINWNGLADLKRSPKGVFLIPENGTSIYLPNRLFNSSNEIEEIEERMRKGA